MTLTSEERLPVYMEGNRMSPNFVERVADLIALDYSITSSFTIKTLFHTAKVLKCNFYEPRESYFLLSFYPKDRYEVNDYYGFALEFNDDPTYNSPRLAFGVRKEFDKSSNRHMVNFFEKHFVPVVLTNDIAGKPEECMNAQHWLRWVFLGDPMQYFADNSSPEISTLGNLARNTKAETTIDDFTMLLKNFLLEY